MKTSILLDTHINSVLGYEKKILDKLDQESKELCFDVEDWNDVKTAVSEACINAIEHGNKEKKELSVHILITIKNDCVYGRVCDYGMGVQSLSSSKPDRGWGLKIIEHLTDSWTVYQTIGEKPQFCFEFKKKLQKMK